MARTRAQRRRQNFLVVLGLVVVMVAALFARDVTRAAHATVDARRSENRTFAQLANGLLAQEASFDQRLATLMQDAPTLTRPIFAARLSQLAHQLPVWQTEATLLRRPVLAHNVNTTLANLTEQRVDDYQVILDTIASSLHLPWTVLNTSGLSVVQAQASLLSTNQQWAAANRALVGEPGRVHLALTSTSNTLVTFSTSLAVLDSAPSLATTRAIGIAAVSVNPAPLPSTPGTLLLPPGLSMTVGVSVSNVAYVDQPVSLSVTLTPLTKGLSSQNQQQSAVIGPLASYGFVLPTFATTPGERATLTVVISGTGASGAPNMSRTRTYVVTVSPSGAG